MDTTLCYIEHNGCYLMMHRNKKSADINTGKWIGIGGKFLDGERPEDCLVREVHEETGLSLCTFDYRGIVHFRNDICEDEEMYLFTATIDHAPDALPECSEGTLAWVPIERVSNLELWEGDKVFLSMLADGRHDIDLTLVYSGDTLIDVIDTQ